MKRTILSLLSLCGAAGALAAYPKISNVRLVQDAGRVVTVTYDLADADAVVTADVLTNGVSIGEANFTNMTGAVNCRVAAGTDRTVQWRPWGSWPDHKLAAGTLKVRLRAWNVADPPDYHVTDLATGDIRYYVSTNAFPGGFWDPQYRTTKLVMRKIPAAMKPFTMGAQPSEIGYADRQRLHRALLTNDFYIGVFEFTQGQWMTLMGTKAGRYSTAGASRDAFGFDADVKPVNQACGYMLRGDSAAARGMPASHAVDAWSLIGKLRARTGQSLTDGCTFDLPSEAEWEFACRAESYTDLPNNLRLTGATTCPNVSMIGFYTGNGGSLASGPVPVGQYLPNGYGLYDMIGNVSELCRNWFLWDESGVREVDWEGPAQAASQGGNSVPARGGNYTSSASGCKCAFRVCPAVNNTVDAWYGFRVSLRLP